MGILRILTRLLSDIFLIDSQRNSAQMKKMIIFWKKRLDRKIKSSIFASSIATMTDGVIGNTSDFGSEESRFDP